MSNALLYGTISVLPLLAGSIIGANFKLKEQLIGTIAAFGAGALIAAVSFGMMEEAFRMGGFDNTILGFLIGGILFVVGDLLIIKFGGRSHKRSYDIESASSGWGIVLGSVLDGIPESIALGLGLLINPKLGLLVLVGIFLSNLPEAISSGYDLKKAGKSTKEIILVWFSVAILGIIFTLLGFTLLSQLSPHILATFESLAAGAILAMLASTMMPEAYKEGGVGSSLATVLGFLIIFVLSKIGV